MALIIEAKTVEIVKSGFQTDTFMYVGLTRSKQIELVYISFLTA